MRRQLVKTVTDILEKDERTVLLLGDIGVYGFREAFARFPKRVYNIGILEQASIGLAAGLAIEGMIPIFHTIAPFIAERAFEQLKIDFGYQRLGGNFVSVGASYDYANLGCTHHCPGDVGVLKTIPGMQIVVPGHPEEFDEAFRKNYANGAPTYFRLSERANESAYPDGLVRYGAQTAVVAIGPMLDRVVSSCEGLDVTIFYKTVVAPFGGADTLLRSFKKIIVVEPFYEGTVSWDIQSILRGAPVETLFIGVPRQFSTAYGTAEEHDEECGLTVESLRDRIGRFVNP